jgi:hypothetical protein
VWREVAVADNKVLLLQHLFRITERNYERPGTAEYKVLVLSYSTAKCGVKVEYVLSFSPLAF